MTEKRLHPSIPSHLSTDLEVLRAVIERSKFQHRSQPFLRRMREVLRLGRRVELLNTDTEVTEDNGSKAVAMEIVVKVRFFILAFVPGPREEADGQFIQCLLKATVSIQQIIDLEHFLPTVISVMAIYGRLFAIGSSIANVLGMEIEESLGVPKRIVKQKRKREERDEIAEVIQEYVYTPAAGRKNPTFDLGQKIARPVRSPSPEPAPPVVSVPVLTPSEESGSPPPSSPDIPPSPVRIPTPPIEKPKKKKKTLAEAGKVKKGKGKKKDDMDDIFGF
jgi:hypothetical protein